MIEKRNCYRLSKSSIVRFRFSKSHLGMSSRCEDICEEGIRLATLQRLLPGMMLDLSFQLHEFTPPILATAKVMWQSDRDNIYYPFAIGLKFTKIDSADRARIRNHIKIASRENSFSIHKTSH